MTVSESAPNLEPEAGRIEQVLPLTTFWLPRAVVARRKYVEVDAFPGSQIGNRN